MLDDAWRPCSEMTSAMSGRLETAVKPGDCQTSAAGPASLERLRVV